MTNLLTQSELQQITSFLGVRFPDSHRSIKAGENLLQYAEWDDSLSERLASRDVLPALFVVPRTDSDAELDICWFPGGLPDDFFSGRTVFVASSRLGHDLQRADWFNALRTLACRLCETDSYLLTGEATAADRFVRRAASLFGIPVVSVRKGPKVVESDWVANSIEANEASEPEHAGYIFRLGPSKKQKALDATLINLASEVRALSVRNGGTVDRAISLRCERMEVPNVFVLDSKSETKPKVLQRLYDTGCHRWILLDESSSDQVEPQRPKLEFRVPIVGELPAGEFLIHCTRKRTGAWPDQSESDFLDDLIFQNDSRDHSLEAALTRILVTGRILATNVLTRDKQKVVCFTSATGEELKNLTKFRSHLSRWDFQPVGIAIRLSALKQRGARPVIYGDEATWESLDAGERPFFQVAKSTTRSGNVIDWTLEKEWRTLGDVVLCEFAPGDVFGLSANS